MASQARPLCHFYSQGRYCHFGKKCRFVHQRSDGAKQALSTLVNKPLSGADASPEQDREPAEPLPEAGSLETPRQEICQPSRAFRPSQLRDQQQQQQLHTRRPCRYFLSGFCAMEDRCRFAHPQRFPPVTDRPAPTEADNVRPRVPVASPQQEANSIRPRFPVARPQQDANSVRPRVPVARPQQGQQEVKLSELTEELAKQLRATEIQQLTKRFPKDRLIVQEREDGKVTYYRVTVQATDPDWVKFMHSVFMLSARTPCCEMTRIMSGLTAPY